jgi:hypothetical protein
VLIVRRKIALVKFVFVFRLLVDVGNGDVEVAAVCVERLFELAGGAVEHVPFEMESAHPFQRHQPNGVGGAGGRPRGVRY